MSDDIIFMYLGVFLYKRLKMNFLFPEMLKWPTPSSRRNELRTSFLSKMASSELPSILEKIFEYKNIYFSITTEITFEPDILMDISFQS